MNQARNKPASSPLSGVAEERRPTAILSAESSARRGRTLLFSRESERASLAYVATDVLQQWKIRWGADVLAGQDESTAIATVECIPIADANAVDGVPLSSLQWKSLHDGRIADDIWWTAAPSALPSEEQSGRSSVVPAVRAGGVAMLSAISKLMFGEAANFSAHGITRKFPLRQEPSSKPRSEREEPVISRDTSMAAELAFSAWIDLCSSFSKRLGLPEVVAGHGQPSGLKKPIWDDLLSATASDLPYSIVRNWSGTLVLHIPVGEARLILLLSGTLAARWRQHEEPAAAPGQPGAAVKLVPLWQALASQGVGITVQLAPMEIDLGSLTALRIGDVLRTGHSLDVPLAVKVQPSPDQAMAGADALCGGFLGKKGGRRAIELLP